MHLALLSCLLTATFSTLYHMTLTKITSSLDAGTHTWYVTPTNPSQLVQTWTNTLLHIIRTKPTHEYSENHVLSGCWYPYTIFNSHEPLINRTNSHMTYQLLLFTARISRQPCPLWILVCIHDISLPRTPHNSRKHELPHYYTWL